METEAALVEQVNGSFQIRKVELEEPRRNEILVKMVSASVCHTDLAVIHGEQGGGIGFPIVLGHEGAGIVERVGEGVTKVKKGDHVIHTVVVHCGYCRNCLVAKPYACENFNKISFGGGLNDGTKRLSVGGRPVSHFFAQSSFARYAVVPENIAVPLPSNVPLEKLPPLSCGVQTGAGAVMNSGIQAGSTIAVYGCGGVGLSAIMGARVIGATEIIAVDTIDERLSLASELGATHTINAKKTKPAEEIKRLTDGGVDYAIECVGRADTIMQAAGSIRGWGTVILVGVPKPNTQLSFDFFQLFNTTIRGCVAGYANSDVFLPMLVKLNEQGRFPFEKLSPKTYRFEEIGKALDDMVAGRVIKPLLKF